MFNTVFDGTPSPSVVLNGHLGHSEGYSYDVSPCCFLHWICIDTGKKNTLLIFITMVSTLVSKVFLLLFIGYNLVHILWSFAINPDMSAIPIMTSLGDFFGSSLLFTAFTLLQELNDENALEAMVYATTPSFNSTINSTLISNPTLSYYY